MKNILIIVGITFVILLSCFIIFVSHASPTQTRNTSVTFPDASSTESQSSITQTVTTPGTASTTLVIATQGPITSIVTKNFINNGITAADVENPGTYYLAGSPGYCLKDGTCPSGASESNFIVTYDEPDQFFTIALTKEPLGAARIAAQQFLLSTLGITQDQLCTLTYYIGTDEGVNPIYSGKNLGFSFCPGATVLP